jgi:hypothetical protein
LHALILELSSSRSSELIIIKKLLIHYFHLAFQHHYLKFLLLYFCLHLQSSIIYLLLQLFNSHSHHAIIFVSILINYSIFVYFLLILFDSFLGMMLYLKIQNPQFLIFFKQTVFMLNYFILKFHCSSFIFFGLL